MATLDAPLACAVSSCFQAMAVELAHRRAADAAARHGIGLGHRPSRRCIMLHAVCLLHHRDR